MSYPLYQKDTRETDVPPGYERWYGPYGYHEDVPPDSARSRAHARTLAKFRGAQS